MKRLLLILTSLVALAASAAEGMDSVAVRPERPVTSVYTFGIGTAHVVDTYLSPIRYEGTHYALGYERWQAMRARPEDLVMRLGFGLEFDDTHNQVRNATMLTGMLRAEWGMYRRWRLPSSMTVAVGGSTSLDAGVNYLSRNGNNPVAAKAAWTVNLTGLYQWRSRLGRLPFTFSYRPTLPLLGAFFSPDYGELYYEIYLGDTSGLAHCAWPGNYRGLDQSFSLDLHLGRTTLRLGYDCRLLTTRANNITANRATHAFVVGISTTTLSLMGSE